MNDDVDHEVPRKKLNFADVASLLRRRVAVGEIKFDWKFPSERHLAKQYNVARGTIQKALAQLVREQLIDIRKGSGAYVVPQPKETRWVIGCKVSHLELMDTRLAIEPHVCRLAILHGRRTDFDPLEELCNTMETHAADPVKFVEADLEFHSALALSTGNMLLAWVTDQINFVRQRTIRIRLQDRSLSEELISKYNVQHRNILNAIHARNIERAVNEMKKHLETELLLPTGKWAE